MKKRSSLLEFSLLLDRNNLLLHKQTLRWLILLKPFLYFSPIVKEKIFCKEYLLLVICTLFHSSIMDILTCVNCARCTKSCTKLLIKTNRSPFMIKPYLQGFTYTKTFHFWGKQLGLKFHFKPYIQIWNDREF